MTDAIPARTCSLPDCERQLLTRGLCRPCYARAWRQGDLPPLEPRWKPLAFPVTDYASTEYGEVYRARFWEKVDASGDCWEWGGWRNFRNYGLAVVRPRPEGASGPRGLSEIPAHRFAWEMLCGPIPDGYQVDHRCFNEGCVNPDHLEPVPPKTNAARRRSHKNSRKIHCVNGHPFDEANTRVKKRRDGKAGRECLACERQRSSSARAARLASGS